MGKTIRGGQGRSWVSKNNPVGSVGWFRTLSERRARDGVRESKLHSTAWGRRKLAGLTHHPVHVQAANRFPKQHHEFSKRLKWLLSHDTLI